MAERSRLWPEAFAARALARLHRVISRLSGGRAGLSQYRLVAQPVAEATLLAGSRGQRIQVRPVEASESEALEFPRPRAIIRQRFAAGARCFGAFRGDELVGFLWLQSGAYQEDEVRCLFRPEPAGEAVWDYDVYVAPKARLSPVFARLWDAVFAVLRREGVAWTMSRVAAANTESLAAHRRLGARIVASALFFAVGPVQLMVATCPPYAHLAWGRGRQPCLRVRA